MCRFALTAKAKQRRKSEGNKVESSLVSRSPNTRRTNKKRPLRPYWSRRSCFARGGQQRTEWSAGRRPVPGRSLGRARLELIIFSSKRSPLLFHHLCCYFKSGLAK